MIKKHDKVALRNANKLYLKTYAKYGKLCIINYLVHNLQISIKQWIYLFL